MLLRWVFALVAVSLLAGCASRPQQSAQAEPVPLILISLDGFRPEYLQRGLTPNLLRLARSGVRARGMRPSYPSLTFPNHYSIVTGLRPDHHGIVANRMQDAELGPFTMENRKAVGDGRWWGGTPLWISLQRQGLRSAAMFWPGSEADVLGSHPHWWFPFDYKTPMDTRVQRVLDWMALPAAERPRFITLYFEHVDSAGHVYGPDSDELNAAVQAVDRAMQQLVSGLARQGSVANLVVVSDHGMEATSESRLVIIDDYVDPATVTVNEWGALLMVEPDPGHEAAVAAALVGEHPHMQCWRKADLPARWHYGSHSRVSAISCQLEPGWYAITRERLARQNGRISQGKHGYDPELESMHAIFIANGPAFKRGWRLPVFDNVDVYPLLARLVGVEPVENDGDPAVLLEALRER